MKKLPLIETIASVVVLTGITTILFLYTSGYRLTKDRTNVVDIKRMGMISAKSIPEGASVYLDGNLVTATNDTLSGIEPKMHLIKIVKKGFVEWTKEVEVFPELVTDITAVLVSQTPRLEPLTNTGAKYPVAAPTMSKLAYFSSDSEKPGIWVTPLNNAGLNFFRSNPAVALQDTKFVKYSEGKALEWSPDEKKLLVTMPNNTFFLVDLEKNTVETAANAEKIRTEWQQVLAKKRQDFIEKLDIPENVKQLAISTKAMWSPDEKKFLYTVSSGKEIEYHVYNMEKPIPVGEKTESMVFKTLASDPQPKVSWYADSFHLILVEGPIEKDKRGSISIIRIDGSNKTEIYNNSLLSDTVFSTPSGDKVIILTSFKSGNQSDLYTVGIR